MITIIILGWILSVMSPPTIIWVLYGALIVFWVFNSIFGVIKALTEAAS